MQRKHKILFFDHDAKLTGSTISMLYIVKTYLKQGYEVGIFTRKKGKFLDVFKAYDVNIYEYSGNPLLGIFLSVHFSDEGSFLTKKGLFTIAKDVLRFWVGLFSTYKILTSVKPDIVYFNEYNMIHCGLVAKLFDIPVITHIRSRFLQGGFGIRKRLLQKAIVGLSDRVFPITQIEANQLESKNQKIMVVSEFLDGNDFIENEQTAKNNSVIMLGGIDFMKGSLDFLKAAEIILNKRSDIKFLLAGSIVEKLFKEEENKYVQEANLLFNKLKVNSNFEYLGIVSNVPEILKQVKILVSSSLLSHFARPVIEAWANNTAVIVADSLHTKSYIQDGINGLVYNSKDYDALADKIEMLIDSNDLYYSLINTGYQEAKNTYSCKNYEILIEETKKVLDEK